jgi:hypothetical protein
LNGGVGKAATASLVGVASERLIFSPMSLVGQWQAIEQDLPEGWDEARLRLDLADESDSERAAALLGPANPGRRGAMISVSVARRHWPSPELVARLLRLLDREGIQGELHAVTSTEAPAAAAPAPPEKRAFLSVWEDELAALPEDWSDLYAEIELDSSDYLDRAALLLAPLNPSRYGSKPGFRFRAASRFGYGASPQMAQRCLERLDQEDIRGTVRVLWALSDTRPVQTQGPVWYTGGKSV